MSTNLPATMQGQLPAHLQNSDVRRTNDELAGGVITGFPILSVRGKVWRIRKGGDEVAYTDADGDAIQSVELVLIKANPALSKIYYAGKYEEGSSDAPLCWSTDGQKPDNAVDEPQHPNCAKCPMNEWGSRITEQGKKARACADNRRMAVAFVNELQAKGTDSHVFLLRVPAASLNPLKDYAEKQLDARGLEYFAVVTKVGFDSVAAYPKLTFKATRFLTEDEYSDVCELRKSDVVEAIVASSADVAAEADQPDLGIEGTPPTGSKPKAKAKPQPVEAEDVEVDEVEVAAPKPEKKAKAKAKPKPVEAKADSEEKSKPASPAKGDDFSEMLDSILG